MEQTMLQNGLAEKPVFRCTYIVDVFFHAVPKKDIVSGTGKKACSVSRGSGTGTSEAYFQSNRSVRP